MKREVTLFALMLFGATVAVERVRQVESGNYEAQIWMDQKLTYLGMFHIPTEADQIKHKQFSLRRASPLIEPPR